MKKLNELMKELGFNESASESTGKAFISNLLRAERLSRTNKTGRVSEWETKKIVKRNSSQEKRAHSVGEQMSFHFEELAQEVPKLRQQKKSS